MGRRHGPAWAQWPVWLVGWEPYCNGRERRWLQGNFMQDMPRYHAHASDVDSRTRSFSVDRPAALPLQSRLAILFGNRKRPFPLSDC